MRMTGAWAALPAQLWLCNPIHNALKRTRHVRRAVVNITVLVSELYTAHIQCAVTSSRTLAACFSVACFSVCS